MEVIETESKDKHAIEQAKNQLAYIVNMVKRLDHTEECDGNYICEGTDEAPEDKEICEGLGRYYEAGKTVVTEEMRDDYHDHDEALSNIEDDPISVQVRSGWANLGEELEPEEFEILLCTGGPAVRIIGELSSGEAKRAWMEYQDWGIPWTQYVNLTEEEQYAIKRYAGIFFTN